MSTNDRHGLANIERVVSLIVGAFFVVVGVLSYTSTGDVVPLILFVAAAVIVKYVVAWLFRLVERVLDSLG